PGPERFRFPDVAPPAVVADPAAPEAAVAYPEGWLRERLGARGLALRGLHPGAWRGGAGTSWQDVVIADRG
ncbi:MAG: class I SAM-dependent methyltransferase, partial [Actinomycetota bacterium]|nr:class I SAM-dependent methyltransferase [Actinomycetota bacterium]